MSQQLLGKTALSKDVRVIIIEDYKLTRVGLRFALNDIENISVFLNSKIQKYSQKPCNYIYCMIKLLSLMCDEAGGCCPLCYGVAGNFRRVCPQ